MTNLTSLLCEASKHFPKSKKRGLGCFNFALSCTAQGLWRFDVINYWQNWLYKGLKFQFGDFIIPDDAVSSFLWYVRIHKLNVKKLSKEK